MMLRIRIVGILVLCIAGFTKLSAQTFTAHYNTTIAGGSCNGFYDYLPPGYNPAGSQKYPLLIALHGAGERGDGSNNSSTGLPLIVIPGKGIASLINSGGFPASFTVNGNTYSFIVICPQFTDNGNTWPNSANLASIINYATANYKVDLNRVYLAGLSMGAGVIFDYVTTSVSNASQIAAITPVCTAIQPGPPYAAKPDSLKCRTITAANLPVWATHNAGDLTVPSTFTDSLEHYINAAPAPTPLARKTIFTSWIFDHDAWTKTFDPNYTGFDFMNIYQWMLQYQRPITPLPVALKTYRAYRSANNTITVAWQPENENNNDHFTLERSLNEKDFTPLATIKGLNQSSSYSYVDEHPLQTNYYRLSQTDIDGKTTIYKTLKVELPGTNEALEIYPNAVNDLLQFSWHAKDKGTINISVYAADGRLVKKWRLNKAGTDLDMNIPVSDLTGGNYFLHVIGNYSHSVKMFRKL